MPPALTYYQCCCPQGKSLSSRILDDQFSSPCARPWSSSPIALVLELQILVLEVQVLEFRGLSRLSVSALCAGGMCWGSYDITSVWLVLWQLCISRRPGRLFETRCLQCCCLRGKSLSSRINFQVLVLESQVLDNNTAYYGLFMQWRQSKFIFVWVGGGWMMEGQSLRTKRRGTKRQSTEGKGSGQGAPSPV